jgi:hypothetical protein
MTFGILGSYPSRMQNANDMTNSQPQPATPQGTPQLPTPVAPQQTAAPVAPFSPPPHDTFRSQMPSFGSHGFFPLPQRTPQPVYHSQEAVARRLQQQQQQQQQHAVYRDLSDANDEAAFTNLMRSMGTGVVDQFCLGCGQEADHTHRMNFVECDGPCWLCGGFHRGTGKVCPVYSGRLTKSQWARRLHKPQDFVDAMLHEGILQGIQLRAPPPSVARSVTSSRARTRAPRQARQPRQQERGVPQVVNNYTFNNNTGFSIGNGAAPAPASHSPAPAHRGRLTRGRHASTIASDFSSTAGSSGGRNYGRDQNVLHGVRGARIGRQRDQYRPLAPLFPQGINSLSDPRAPQTFMSPASREASPPRSEHHSGLTEAFGHTGMDDTLSMVTASSQPTPLASREIWQQNGELQLQLARLEAEAARAKADAARLQAEVEGLRSSGARTGGDAVPAGSLTSPPAGVSKAPEATASTVPMGANLASGATQDGAFTASRVGPNGPVSGHTARIFDDVKFQNFYRGLSETERVGALSQTWAHVYAKLPLTDFEINNLTKPLFLRLQECHVPLCLDDEALARFSFPHLSSEEADTVRSEFSNILKATDAALDAAMDGS